MTEIILKFVISLAVKWLVGKVSHSKASEYVLQELENAKPVPYTPTPSDERNPNRNKWFR